MVRDFRELRVYQMAFASAMSVFDSSRSWPADERHSLAGQIRRSTRSVCANIAEAWRKRRYRAAFVSKLHDADAEAGETLVWLDFAKACGYLPEEAAQSFRDGLWSYLRPTCYYDSSVEYLVQVKPFSGTHEVLIWAALR
jgi:four helix bundle protein